MRRVKMIFFFSLTVCSTLFTEESYAQKWNWGNLMSVATYDVLPFGMSKDASGNLYLVGNTDEIPVFPNPITPMGGLLSGTHPQQGYLTKINASGTYQWFR
ncbi:MAG: hypothetical protein JWM14_1282, partial [Chitinophagaceae bacterium]|nr:hypothetical protein [Chitinophagaceae bacterium]